MCGDHWVTLPGLLIILKGREAKTPPTTTMKAFCASFALISSLASVHGCTLESCALRQFRNCAFNDNSCRGKETLDLQGKSLSGVIPVAFYTLLGTTLQGNADDGIPPVKLKKVYMQSNSLTHVENLFACSTIQEMYVKSPSPSHSFGLFAHLLM